jgi:hypothetical protein
VRNNRIVASDVRLEGVGVWLLLLAHKVDARAEAVWRVEDEVVAVAGCKLDAERGGYRGTCIRCWLRAMR